MKPINILLIGLIGLYSVPVVAQKKVPHSFRYQAEPSDRNQLRFLTQVTQSNTTFLRLYFAGTQLGEGSYLVLEGADGARQELRKQDLENWRYSSAYFNGQSVKISLFAAPGDRNTVQISEIRVTDPQAGQAQNARKTTKAGGFSLQTTTSSPANLTATYPHAKAVGRFTNGIEASGTGWIAPNGAIVTSGNLEVSGVDKEIIEFNVPPSVGTTVIHPAPEDQYPLQWPDGRSYGSYKVAIKGDGYLSPDLSWYEITEALPNATGLRPGERQQAYFRIATNPSNWVIDTKEDADQTIPVDIFHYGGGHPNTDPAGTYRTLGLIQTTLLKQNSYLGSSTEGDRDWYTLYNMPYFDNSAEGAPVTYQGSNVAIGAHSGIGGESSPGYGLGFATPDFRNNLARFFASNAVYVDPEGLSDPGTGEIHKPFRTANKAASDAPAGSQVYFARGDYHGPTTFNRPMTLRAPVGTVTVGLPFSSARKADGSTIPSHWLEEGSSLSFDRESAEAIRVRAYPNPFREQVEINYPFAEGKAVSVRIFNLAGVPVSTLTPNKAASGQNGVQWNGTDQNGMSVPAGLYVVQVNDGNQIVTTKVLKK